MNTTIAIIFALIFGLTIVLFENWYAKYRTRKTKNICEQLLPKFGWNKSTGTYSDYSKTDQKYSVSLNHLRKKNFFDMHTIRTIIDFDTPVAFPELNDFVYEKRKKYHEINWVGNSVFHDFEFYLISDNKIREIEAKLTLMIDVLISENLKPLNRIEGRKQGEEFDNWQMEN